LTARSGAGDGQPGGAAGGDLQAWLEGDEQTRDRVYRWLVDEHADKHAHVLAESPRRRLVLLTCADAGGSGAGDLLVKHFRGGLERHRLREALKLRLGLTAVRREWRMLQRLWQRGLAVPRPLGRARLRDGGEILVLEYIHGRSLAEALTDSPSQKRELLTLLGRRVRELHEAGLAHRDLHIGNVHVGGDGPTLLDFQRARRAFGRRSRLRDVGELDFSLAHHGVSCASRVRVRRSALAQTDGRLGAEERRLVRAAGRASVRRAQRYFRSRTRRSLRPGRRFARLRQAHGMRLRELPEEAVHEALAAHRAAISQSHQSVLKHDHRARVSAVQTAGRRIIVKEVVKRGHLRQLADLVRGSAGRRAWLGGHGLQARGVAAATPLAFVELRRMGLPLRSTVLLEDVRPAEPVHESSFARADPAAVMRALCRLAVAMHSRGALHGDFQSLHVLLADSPAGDGEPALRLIDLEGVRFPRRLREGDRIKALAELNASLPDDLVPAAMRLESFRRYARALPFASGAHRALREIVRQGLARGHHWSGAACTLAGVSRSGRR